MKFLRDHWYDIGAIFAIAVIIFLWKDHEKLSFYQAFMWFSLLTLLLHQLEEYRWPGTFPGMINKVIGKSNQPDHYPLNSNTSLIINVSGWIIYFLAAFFAEKSIWLGIISIMISFGNFIAHTFLFNIKGKTIYNAGMITSWLFFLPCTIIFIQLISRDAKLSISSLVIGTILGIVVNISILKAIFWLASPNSPYKFSTRQLISPAKD